MTSASASRVTRSSRSLRLALLLFAGALAVAGVLRAQETAPPAPAATGPSEAPPAAGEPARDPAAEAGRPTAKGSPPANAGPTPGRFEPTEKVRADFDVAFPVDI